MLHFISTLTLALCAVAAPAGPALVRRQQTTICGGNSYTPEETAAASQEGCRLYWLGQQIGRSNYPHSFSNFEGLVFPVAGPYEEFPILENRLYTGGECNIAYGRSRNLQDTHLANLT